MLAQAGTSAAAGAGRKGAVPQRCTAPVMFDPFEQLCCIPFEDLSSASSSSDEAGAEETASPANSIESFHDEGLISSCDGHAVEFLLYALALQDQEPSQSQPQAPRESPEATCVTCPLARTAAGALDAMLLQDCVHTGIRHHDVVKKTTKQPAEHKEQDSLDSE